MEIKIPTLSPKTLIAVFPIPKTTALSYEKTFTKVDELTTIQLKHISDSRQEVVIASERAFADAAIKGVDKYLPHLFGLMDACNQMPPDFSRHLNIDWSTSLGKEPKLLRASNWYWECINVMLCYGLLLRKAANDELASIPEDQFGARWTDCTKKLRTAAGVFEFIAENVASKYFVFPKDMPVPEVIPETFALLKKLCVVEAQELVVKRGLQKEDNPSMAAQLCQAASNEYESCYGMADKIQIPEKEKSQLIKQDYRTFFQWKSQLWQSWTYYYMYIHHMRSIEPGIALAYIEMAYESISKPNKENKKHDENLETLWTHVTDSKNMIKELLEQANKDNDNIYHELVKRDKTVIITPQLIPKPVQFDAPSPAEIKLNLKEMKGICIIQ